MIYITGDTHIPIDIGKLGTKRFPAQKDLTKNDYVMICGDFGGVWNGGNEEKYWRKWLEQKSFTTVFVDGNHENFDLLEAFPIVDFHGAAAHKVGASIFHIKRGETFVIDGKRFFAFGGAASHDQEYRTEGKSWWRQELPTLTELEYARKKLADVNYTVDYIITHCAPCSGQREVSEYRENILTSFLEEVSEKVSCKKWFFGHYHTDKEIGDRYIALFDRINEVE